ncbi:hypothetical protein DNTS_008122 [Danionella cerebrum]|uniref:Uncharacterized protein n=1 Tax=Danionella cerebrum TaxID=2873325 RepID=A0A553N398_9TELE|nr:hypothetical protein DNTS_008122 [Danionella translucida]
MPGGTMKTKSAKRLKEVQTVTEALKTLYRQKLLPLEKFYRFSDFHSSCLEDADFDNKPMILVLGQCSTGKTTFIKFQCVHFPNRVLESISIIDTPGILSVAKHRMNRGYDFPAVIRWFAEHVDRIILLCDAHKLEISDEFSHTILALQGNEDKLRVVLNKADTVDSQELMRVYGALMWSLGKVFCTPEVLRVYIGSFWSSPMCVMDNRMLFEREEEDLFADIQSLPRNSAQRKLNDLVKRARLVRAHSYIISSLQGEMPVVFCREKKKRELIYDLPVIYSRIQQRHQISPGDFPDCGKMQERLMSHDFKFKALNIKLLAGLDQLLSTDIAKLMPLLRLEEEEAADQLLVQGGPFLGAHRGPFMLGSPFHDCRFNGESAQVLDKEWAVLKDKPKYDEIFYSLSPYEGKLSGSKVKGWMMSTGLPSSVLGRIWRLADVDEDGKLDVEEFALAGYLIEVRLEGFGLPHELPANLVPPSKRQFRNSKNTDNDLS